jgi:hypothetical protein
MAIKQTNPVAGRFVPRVHCEVERIACTNEDKELQRLLENNLDLLPGEQINPEEKLRWLLIKREMPVTNPASGEIWWSIDFFLVDQFGIPTLVECKRRNDTRSRREVVGQMLEYAANACRSDPAVNFLYAHTSGHAPLPTCRSWLQR